MELKLVIFASCFMKPDVLRIVHAPILTALKQNFNLHWVDASEADSLQDDDFCIAFIASGGTEQLYQQSFSKLSRPYLLLADGQANSFAAALEISAWIRQTGQQSEILHGSTESIIARIRQIGKLHAALCALQDKRIGVIGTPSSWLIASEVDFFLAKQRWGVNYVSISLERLVHLYHEVEEKEIEVLANQLMGATSGFREATPKDLREALRIYMALKTLVKEERLDALTLACFNLIEQTGTTGCLALSLLNDEGIIAGCEGDLQTVFTMLVAKTLTGQDTFMANPSMIDAAANELLISHCTIGLKQTERFCLRSHFESGKGIAIQGILPTGPITLLRCGGECLDTYFVSRGILLENTDNPNMCRTQVRLRLETPVNYFLHHPIGNHHVLIAGDYSDLFHEFFSLMGCALSY